MSLRCLFVCLHCLVQALLAQTTTADDSNTGTVIAVAIVSAVLCMLVIAIGYTLYRRRMQQSLNNDISNLDIEEVTQSDLPDTTKNGKKHSNANNHAEKAKQNKSKNKNKNKNKQKEKTKSKGNRKHSTDVLDLEEEDDDDDNTTKPTQATQQIIVTTANGQVSSNGHHANVMQIESDDDLSYQGNLHTPQDDAGNGQSYADPSLDAHHHPQSGNAQHSNDLDIDLDDEASD